MPLTPAGLISGSLPKNVARTGGRLTGALGSTALAGLANSALDRLAGSFTVGGRKTALAAARSRPDPLTNIAWTIVLPPITVGTEKFQLSWEYVEEAQLPFREFDSHSQFQAGQNISYPGISSVSNLSLTCYEDILGTATAYFQAWQALIYNPTTGVFGSSKNYKKSISIVILDQAQQSVVAFEYLKCWPARPDGYTLQSGQVERLTPRFDISVGSVVVNVVKTEDLSRIDVMKPSSILSTLPQSALGLSTSLAASFNGAAKAKQMLGL